MRLSLHRLLCFAVLLLSPASAQAFDRIMVLITGPTAAGEEFIHAFRRQLNTGTGPQVSVRSVSEPSAAPEPGTLVVAVGVQALQHAASLPGSHSVLGILVPQPAYEKIHAAAAASVSAIFLDQPPARQMRLLRRLLPHAGKVGLLLGPTSSRSEELLARSGRTLGLEPLVTTIHEESELTPALIPLLESSDVLLAVPDPLVHQPATAQTLLLTSYRYRKPVIGYSQAYVTAGALAAAYSSPADIARQAAEIVHAHSGAPAALPPPQPPRYFSIGINRHVARSLGIALPDVAHLTASLIKEEQ